MLVCLFRLLIRKRGPLQKIRAINSEAPLFIILDLIQHEIINAIDFMENYNGCANWNHPHFYSILTNEEKNLIYHFENIFSLNLFVFATIIQNYKLRKAEI